MSSGINSFRIRLDKLTGNYHPGEKITGEVIIDLYKEKIVKGIHLCSLIFIIILSSVKILIVYKNGYIYFSSVCGVRLEFDDTTLT